MTYPIFKIEFSPEDVARIEACASKEHLPMKTWLRRAVLLQLDATVGKPTPTAVAKNERPKFLPCTMCGEVAETPRYWDGKPHCLKHWQELYDAAQERRAREVQAVNKPLHLQRKAPGVDGG